MRSNPLAIFFAVLIVAGCGQAGPKPPSVSELNDMLRTEDAKAQLEAAHWVKQLGPKAAETAPALIAALGSPSQLVRQNAATALGHIGPAAAAAVPALTKALSDPQYNVRKAATDALGQLGPAAAAAIPELEKIGKQADPCDAAPAALKKIRQ